MTGTLDAPAADTTKGTLAPGATADGKILWDFDTATSFDTVNKVAAKGGSVDGPGPTIANGIVLTNSGYGAFGGIAGNVLLAFSVDGK